MRVEQTSKKETSKGETDMYNRRYDKAFLMLRQEAAGYGMNQRTPWGSCVLEIKNGGGKIQITVQGLRSLQSGCYEVYAIGEEERVFCGNLVPERGKGGSAELKWSFHPDHVGDTSMAVEALHTIAVVAQIGGSREHVCAPLTAYFAEKKDWKRVYLHAEQIPKKRTETQNREGREAIDCRAERQEHTEEADIVDVGQERVLKVASTANEEVKPVEDKKTPACHGSFRGLIKRFQEELVEIEESGLLSSDEIARIEIAGMSGGGRLQTAEEAMREDVKNDGGYLAEDEMTQICGVVETAEENDSKVNIETKNTSKITQDGGAGDERREEAQPDAAEGFSNRFRYVFVNNEEVEPFEDDGTWKMISLEELVILEEIPLNWLKDFFFLLAMQKYHHLIFKETEKRFVLGVPAEYNVDDAGVLMDMGFDHFKPLQQGSPLGYWIYAP